MTKDEQTELLITLHNIEDRLKEITEILRVTHKEAIEGIQRKVLSGSQLRKRIYERCDGTQSVGDIARDIGKSIQQISNNITILQNAGLIEEIRKGKEKCYLRTK